MAELDVSLLSEEAFSYLNAAGGLCGKPIDRLLHMNRPAYELFLSRGVDLKRERLPVALCAQHCNGGVSVDADWQTTIPGLFAAGECAGTHGVTRPGGSALNAGQVGALRAAQAIGAGNRAFCGDEQFAALAAEAEKRHEALIRSLSGEKSNVAALTELARERFSRYCGPVRVTSAFETIRNETETALREFTGRVKIASLSELPDAYRLRDALTVQAAMVAALEEYHGRFGASRGSAVYVNEIPAGSLPPVTLAEGGREEIQQVKRTETGYAGTRRPVRPLPETDPCFENVWRAYRERQERAAE